MGLHRASAGTPGSTAPTPRRAPAARAGPPRPGLRAGRPRGLRHPLGRGAPAPAPGSASRTRGPWTRSTTRSPCWRTGDASPAPSSPAASSRCWPSPGCCGWGPGCCCATSRPRVSSPAARAAGRRDPRDGQGARRHRPAGRAEPALRDHRRGPALPAGAGARRRDAPQRRGRAARAGAARVPRASDRRPAASDADRSSWKGQHMRRTIVLAGHRLAASACWPVACGRGGPASERRTARSPTTRSCSAVLNDQSGVYADLSGKNSVEAVRMAVEDFLKAEHGDDAVTRQHRGHHGRPPEQAGHRQHQGAGDCTTGSTADIILDVPTSSAALAVADARPRRRRSCSSTSARPRPS